MNSLSADASTSAVSLIGLVLSDKGGAPRSRRAAARVLSGMKTAGAGAELAKHVSDADPEIRAAAVSRKPRAPKAPAAPRAASSAAKSRAAAGKGPGAKRTRKK